MVIPRPAAAWGRRLLAGLGRDLAGFWAVLRPQGPLRPGLYAYELHPAGGSRRVHLRIEADGSGVLLIDVADAVHLNPAAALLAKLALDRTPPEAAVLRLRRLFPGADGRREVREIYQLVEHLATTADACPTCGLEGIERRPWFGVPVRAPYKADLALSYGCNNACRHCYNERGRREMPSLSPDEWRRVLDRLAAIGVPHVIFTGGEPTLFPALADLVRHACRLGLVAGLNTNGRRLRDAGYARSLARAGLDHVQITLESYRGEIHDAMTGAAAFQETVAGIRGALAAGLHTITNTTLTRRNAGDAEQLLNFLHDLGLRTVAFNGMIYSGQGRTATDAIPERELGPLLVRLRGRAAELGLRLLWYTPTAWCRLSPVELELGPRRCNAGQYSMCIEPNGDVLPCQSYYERAGNLLADPWESIWNSPLFRSFRDRIDDPRGCGLPQECWDCPDLPACGGGCRLERERGGG